MGDWSDVLEGRARWELLAGDSMQVLPYLPAESIDALVTDPPAGIGFMGKEWDSSKGGRARWVMWLGSVMLQAYRVMKPGAHGLVWALPRTSHWTATALEDAGFEVRDRVSHLFGTGFPKSLNIGEGRGTALKPAVEDWWLVRKPLAGTVAENVARYGTGALNVDGCRIAAETRPLVVSDRRSGNVAYGDGLQGSKAAGSTDLGRWPAHLVLDEEAAALLDAQSGTLKAQGNRGKSKGGGGLYGHGLTENAFGAGDSGGASRFFYVAKSSTSERNSGGANNHPTVKPLALMRWLVRLITPPGGVVLDPFAGSGSTGIAALAEGARFIGVEREEAYARIARARLEEAARPPAQPELFAEADRG